eukprot:scaffold1804_cov263-Pinguiococcus_pyrenoidosus.AAC.19
MRVLHELRLRGFPAGDLLRRRAAEGEILLASLLLGGEGLGKVSGSSIADGAANSRIPAKSLLSDKNFTNGRHAQAYAASLVPRASPPSVLGTRSSGRACSFNHAPKSSSRFSSWA